MSDCDGEAKERRCGKSSPVIRNSQRNQMLRKRRKQNTHNRNTTIHLLPSKRLSTIRALNGGHRPRITIIARQTFEDDSSLPNVPNMNKAGYSRLANLLDMESVVLE
jgi:hypothetical protein